MHYWIIVDNQRVGPLSIDDLRNMDIKRDTLVWHEGMPTWRQAGLVPELAPLLPPRNPMPVMPWQQQAQTAMPHNDSRQAEPIPPTYLAWNIVAMILCCLPTGLVGLIYSTMVQPRYMRGDYKGAKSASSNAEIWLIVSIVAGVIALPFQIVIAML